MIGIGIIILVVGGFICFTANKKTPSANQTGYRPMPDNRRAFKSGPRQIYDPTKTTYKEDDIYFSGGLENIPLTQYTTMIYAIAELHSLIFPVFVSYSGESQPLIHSMPVG